jgi:hypothetical protein
MITDNHTPYLLYYLELFLCLLAQVAVTISWA